MTAEHREGSSTLSGVGQFIQSIAKAFPGIPVASEARGKAKANQVMLGEIERMRGSLIQQGYSQSTVDGMCLHYINECSKSNNLAECLAIAQSELGRDYETSKIDHSWFLRWSDGASEQFDDEMRLIWGKVLSGELDQPGSYSKRTLSILSDMGARDAGLFQRLCSLCARCVDEYGNITGVVPCVFLDNGGASYCDGEMTYSEIAHLASLELVVLTSKTSLDVGELIVIDGDRYAVEGDAKGPVSFSDITLTNYGNELSQLSGDAIGSHRDLLKFFEREAQRQGGRIVRA
ncbi:DUF2806 domain-containing protein [Olsenella sp. SW781]|uniref:DUF2806 domain-containing protein n=1 Tax=Olsenella sp. SW781 TaxID=2530046 RepID=UPI00143CBFD4|nr:DUF2806 domain-containing protein [Olsenella sp. SW781]